MGQESMRTAQTEPEIEGLLSPFLRRKRLEEVMKWLAGNSVLDYGCGRGELLSMMGGGWKYVGIDLNPDFIRFAQRRFPQANFRVLNLEDCQSPDLGKFDCIVAAAIIEHLECPERLLKELSRHLRDGGRLIITTPSPRGRFLLSIGARIGLLNRRVEDTHRSILSAEDLLKLMRACPLQVRSYSTFLLGLNQLLVAEKGS